VTHSFSRMPLASFTAAREWPLLSSVLAVAVIVATLVLRNAPRPLRLFYAAHLVSFMAVLVPVLLHPTFLSLVLPIMMVISSSALLLWCRDLACDTVAAEPPSALTEGQSPIRRLNRQHEERVALHVVSTAKLRAALRQRSANSLLRELCGNPDSDHLLLDRIIVGRQPSSGTAVGIDQAPPFGLISYRQEYDAADGTTMDGTALESIVKVAEAAGITALWCDSWCYKTAGAYDHQRFCSTLAAVVLHATEVIWLPRSRPQAKPTYQFRASHGVSIRPRL
jgi:hypothetical protein